MEVHVNDQADGQLSESGGRWQIRFERRLDHPREKVWRALTEPEHRDAWFPQRIEADGDWVAGARLRFVSDLMSEANFGGELLVYDPPRTLEMRWGTDVLRFELAADGDGTLLTLTDTIEERGTAARTGAGWHTCLDTLAYALACRPDRGRGRSAGARSTPPTSAGTARKPPPSAPRPATQCWTPIPEPGRCDILKAEALPRASTDLAGKAIERWT